MVLAVVVTAVLTAGSILARVHYSVSVIDEAFYLAMPYRFLLGARPFVDEWNPLQSTSFLAYPFVKGYVALTGGTGGIVLAARLAYLAFSACMAAIVARGAATFVRWPLAALVGVAVFSVIPWNIAALSYNTLGAGFLLGGLFATLIRTTRWPAWTPLAIAGLLHSLAVLAYPPLAVAVAVHGILLFARAPRRPGAWVPYLLPLLAVVGLGGGLTLAAAWPHRGDLVVLETQGGGLDKLLVVAKSFIRALRKEPLLLAAALIVAASYRWAGARLRGAAAIAVVLLPVVVRRVGTFQRANMTLAVTLFVGVFALLLLAWPGIAARTRAALGRVLAPALAGGVLTAYSSDNGLVNAGIGMVAALGVALLLQVIILAEVGRSFRPALAAWLPFAPVFVLLGLLHFHLWRGVYDDAPIRQLTARVESGPFAGLRTTPEQAQFVVDAERAVRRSSMKGDRVLFYDFFPAGYLMTDLPSATNTAWSADPVRYPGAPDRLLAYYARGGEMPTLVFRRKWGVPVATSHPVDHYFAPRCRPVVVDERFEICRVGR